MAMVSSVTLSAPVLSVVSMPIHHDILIQGQVLLLGTGFVNNGALGLGLQAGDGHRLACRHADVFDLLVGDDLIGDNITNLNGGLVAFDSKPSALGAIRWSCR